MVACRRLILVAAIGASAICVAQAAPTTSTSPSTVPPPAPAPDPARSAGYPASPAEADVLEWLKAHTTIARPRILALEPGAAIALAGHSPSAAGAPARAEVREELIAPSLAAKAQARSVLYTLELDCGARRFRVLGRTFFALPDLQGPGRNQASSPPWSAVDAATPIGKAWQAVCTPDFVFPYARPAAPPPAAKPYLVVLGSFTVAANAQVAARILQRGFSAMLVGRSLAVRPATVDGRDFTVVTVSGFAGLKAARDFCTKIKPSGLECAPRPSGPKR